LICYVLFLYHNRNLSRSSSLDGFFFQASNPSTPTALVLFVKNKFTDCINKLIMSQKNIIIGITRAGNLMPYKNALNIKEITSKLKIVKKMKNNKNCYETSMLYNELVLEINATSVEF